MSQSSELTGGEGFTFEGYVAAYYLTALLAEDYASGIEDRTVVRVSVQQRSFGEPLDDVIVDFKDSSNNRARLSLQVKRSLTISRAITNQAFREIIRDSWATLNKPGFRIHIDRYGAAVDTVSSVRKRELKALCDQARESLAADHFNARFGEDGSASAARAAVKHDVVALLEEAKGAACTSEEVHRFLAHFVLIQFDFLREGSTDPPDAINRIRDCLTPDDMANAPLVWSRIVQLARSSASQSGQFDRARLVHLISPVAHLRGAVSLRPDLDKLTELANAYANLIPDDIGGAKLDRAPLHEQLDTKLAAARVVQIRGLPGSGKSVEVKRAVQRALEHGPTIFLKAEQLEGTSWVSYAASQGLSGTPLEQLLVEIETTGTPILFIDAIDRINKRHQPIIINIIHAIVESPLLNKWRIVVSLRDTGIEMLRNWLGEFLNKLGVETLNVDQLSNEEAETLAEAKPHLRPLLFGSTQVQEIVRRPFFAKVLDQSYVTDPTFAPRSEIDLIENWWRRGGFNETGQSALERQRTLLDLASVHSHQLSQPINLSQLTVVTHIDELIRDGILQRGREGISVRFAHDIFFEWAFFHVLADCRSPWMEVIKTCGEPPAVARVVELASQWEYAQGTGWQTYLPKIESSDLRSQWLRAWLVGPLGTVRFEDDESQFAMVVFADDFSLFRKVLVWFQAEKTSPNKNILAGTLPWEQRQQIADLLGWPSDVAAWCRLIGFILRRISDIPQRLYPEIVTIFEVWQNALADHCNPTSQALLQQCASWLADIDAVDIVNEPDENFAYWEKVPGLDSFRKSLCQLLLRSSRAEPTFATDYLQRTTNLKRIQDDVFHDIIFYSRVLAQSLPQQLVELSLTFLREELPDEQVARERKRIHDVAEWRRTSLTKPKTEYLRQEKMAHQSSFFVQNISDFSGYYWECLSIREDSNQSFWPPSPLREPFHSLFQSSPDEALRLLRELCNHAMSAWRQAHGHSRNHKSTPIPLELTFPWGTQTFWGTDREYLWFRSTRAPKAIGCAFLALEAWCFDELERSQTVDELIRKIVEGNECIAILGVAAMLALHTEKVSETTLPLFTSQRLLAADHKRIANDLSPAANLIGFMSSVDPSHIEAIRKANSRPVRRTQLTWMVPRFVFAAEPLCNQARELILNFRNDLPYQYEEDRDIPEIKEDLTARALRYAELADLKNYQVRCTEEDPDQKMLVHISPSATEPENVARDERDAKFLRQMSLFTWASRSFEEKTLNDTHTIKEAIVLAKETDTNNLFEYSSSENEEEHLGMHRGAVAATAAIVLNSRKECTHESLEWARNVLARAIRLPEKFDLMWCPESTNSQHQGIYVARGLAADIREGTAAHDTAHDLLRLIAHPLEIVSLAAVEETCKLWPQDPKLTWAALILAFSLCHVPRRSRNQPRQHNEARHTSSEAQAAVDVALTFYENESEGSPLPLPPPAWKKVTPGKDLRRHQIYEDYDVENATSTTEVWDEPDVFWHSRQAAEILQRIPFDEILDSSAENALLDFLDSVLKWTNQKNAPPWVKPERRDQPTIQILGWTHTLGSRLGFVAGLIPLTDFQDRFLDSVLGLKGNNCWALLSPFASTYVCTYVYDAPVVPVDAVAILDLCLERLLQDSAFKRDAYRGEEVSASDIDRLDLVHTLMFVSVERADSATRYVNGDWSEISRILPLIDRLIRAGGWATSVMDPFLTLCERAKVSYPAEAFADQILAIIGDGPDNLKGWHGPVIPARIAGLVQHFAHRDAPMAPTLAQKFLRILDMLVDMGDRRSAALQLSDAFREVQLPS